MRWITGNKGRTKKLSTNTTVDGGGAIGETDEFAPAPSRTRYFIYGTSAENGTEDPVTVSGSVWFGSGHLPGHYQHSSENVASAHPIGDISNDALTRSTGNTTIITGGGQNFGYGNVTTGNLLVSSGSAAVWNFSDSKVINGDFETDFTGWTPGAGWSVVNNKASCSGAQGSDSTLATTVGLVGIQNKPVGVEFIVTRSAGTLSCHLQGTSSTPDISGINSSGTYSFGGTSTDSAPKIIFTASADFVGTIDGVSCREVGTATSGNVTISPGDSLSLYGGTNNAGYLQLGNNGHDHDTKIYGTTTFYDGIANANVISAGTWQGTDIGVAYGGTGASSFTSSQLLYGNGTGAIQDTTNITTDGSWLTARVGGFKGKTHLDTAYVTTIDKSQGTIVTFGSTTSMIAGSIYYLDNLGGWQLANADTPADATGMMGLALGASSDVHGILLNGVGMTTADSGNMGDILYLATTNGRLTSTTPSSSGDTVRVMGYALHATSGLVYFNPSGTWVEIA